MADQELRVRQVELLGFRAERDWLGEAIGQSPAGLRITEVEESINARLLELARQEGGVVTGVSIPSMGPGSVIVMIEYTVPLPLESIDPS
jgi:hypothetical protein